MCVSGRGEGGGGGGGGGESDCQCVPSPVNQRLPFQAPGIGITIVWFHRFVI